VQQRDGSFTSTRGALVEECYKCKRLKEQLHHFQEMDKQAVIEIEELEKSKTLLMNETIRLRDHLIRIKNMVSPINI
jgi:hypothetical protein